MQGSLPVPQQPSTPSKSPQAPEQNYTYPLNPFGNPEGEGEFLDMEDGDQDNDENENDDKEREGDDGEDEEDEEDEDEGHGDSSGNHHQHHYQQHQQPQQLQPQLQMQPLYMQPMQPPTMNGKAFDDFPQQPPNFGGQHVLPGQQGQGQSQASHAYMQAQQAQALAQAHAHPQVRQVQGLEYQQPSSHIQGPSPQQSARPEPEMGDSYSPYASNHHASSSSTSLMTPSQSQSLANTTTSTPAFRALPLLSTDIPHTRISVSHSSIRPNDRGKEVLSFIVVVDPGRGKEPWKVEKLYSDVLSLDQRIRASVAKGVSKKLASLPEGKLWRDNAPAKVDQRKVSTAFSIYIYKYNADNVGGKDCS
jgi:RalA-binding protein 1